jgi:hypothetical protein
MMYGWIVQKDRKSAAALVKSGLAEYVLPGTKPHPEQMRWRRSLDVGDGLA